MFTYFVFNLLNAVFLFFWTESVVPELESLTIMAQLYGLQKSISKSNNVLSVIENSSR